MWRATENQDTLREGQSSTGGKEMMTRRSLDQLLLELDAMAPLGYSAGLHIRFAAPLFYARTYPEAWIRTYDDNAFALRDPLVFWGLGVKGQTRWSDIRLPDPFNIIGQARQAGLLFGAVISYGPITSRSIVGISRDDREYSEDEIDAAAVLVREMHEMAEPPAELTPAQAEALRLLAEGDRHTAAAAKLGISESAFKARLQSARVRLGARTTAQALKKAREYRLL